MYYGIQVTALVLLCIVIINFFRIRTMPLRSMGYYAFVLISSFLFALVDILEVYVCLHSKSVSVAFFTQANRLTMILLLITGYQIFLYMNSKRQLSSHRVYDRFYVNGLPLFIGIICLVFLPLTTFDTDVGTFASGPMVFATYAVLFIYFLFDILLLITHKDDYSKEERFTFALGIVISLLTAFMKIRYPMFPLAALAICILVISIYIVLENPKEFNDSQIPSAMNRNAFCKIVQEAFDRGKPFYILTTTVSENSMVRSAEGYGEFCKILSVASDRYKMFGRPYTYRTRSNCISTILYSEKELHKLEEHQEEGLRYNYDDRLFLKPKYFVSVIECPALCTSLDEVLDMIEYASSLEEEIVEDEEIIYMDESAHEKMLYNLKVEELVHKAILEDGFEVHFQPIYNTSKSRITSAEALVRLKDVTTLGFVSPEVFISIAEKKGMIRDLGDIVFDKVCKFASDSRLWLNHGIDYIEVNLSRIQGIDPTLPLHLKNCMDKYEIPSSFIKLEITESAFVQCADLLETNILALNAMGLGFAMDDFGTGYSNFSQLMGEKYDLIKLDKSLLWPCFASSNFEQARVVLDHCIEMIHELGLSIVAEGVETKEQVDYLVKHKVKYLQGYYYSRPLNSNDFLRILG